MNLIPVIDDIFHQITFFLTRLEKEAYKKPLEIFSGSSIGQHTRHIIEFFQCLTDQIEQGLIDYDARKRNSVLEEEPEVVISEMERLSQVLLTLSQPTNLALTSSYLQGESGALSVNTSIERELLYNIEHAVHHLAMIKMGIKQVAPDMILPEQFGIAKSTISYYQQKQSA